MARKQGTQATALTVITGYHIFRGKSVVSVEESGENIIVVRKPPRKSKPIRAVYGPRNVLRYAAGEGREGAYAIVYATMNVDDRPLVGELSETQPDGSFGITTEDGVFHVFCAPVQEGAVHDVVEADDGEERPARKSRRVADEEPPRRGKRRVAEEEEYEDEDGDIDDTDDDFADDDDNEEPPRRGKTKAKAKSRRAAEEEEYEDEDGEGEGGDYDDDDEEPPRRKKTAGRPAKRTAKPQGRPAKKDPRQAAHRPKTRRTTDW